MDFLFIIKFFGGLILIFSIGYIVAYFLKLGKYSNDDDNEKNEDEKNDNSLNL
jgi:NhaP-type Na+/H+ or K+/H+ antiporter